jgi:preprotein translocase subunit SecG
MLYYIVVALYVLVCFLLMLVVLLQQGKGGDIAAAFGGGASQTAFGARAGATVLSRATTILAVLFVLGALALGILRQTAGQGSVVGGRASRRAPAPAGAPATQKPAAPATAAPSTPAPAPQSSTPAPAK